MQPDWEDVRHFTALARTLNLARAAAELQTSQATVMRRVKALEGSLGAILFLRRRDGHRLTAAGTELLRSSREASLLIEDGLARVTARDRRAGGHVRIATTELAANWILLPALPPFLRENAELSVEIDAAPQPLGLLDDAETIALRFQRPRQGPFRIRKLGAIGFSVYRSAAMPECGRYIGWAGSFADISLARWLRQLRGEAAPVLTLTTFEGHLQAVRNGVGASALPDFIGRNDPALTTIIPEGPPFMLEAWLVVPEQIASLVKVIKATRFIEHAMKQVTEQPARGRVQPA